MNVLYLVCVFSLLIASAVAVPAYSVSSALTYDATLKTTVATFTITTAPTGNDSYVNFWVVPSSTKVKLGSFGSGIVCGTRGAGGANFTASGCFAYTCSAAGTCAVDTVLLGAALAGGSSTFTVTRPLKHVSGNIIPGVPFWIVSLAADGAYNAGGAILETAALSSYNIAAASSTVTQYKGDLPAGASFTFATSAPDAMVVTFPTVADTLYGIGWGATSTSVFPNWALICGNKTSKVCVALTCTAADTCTPSDTVYVNTAMNEVTATLTDIQKIIGVATSSTTGALTMTYGSQANLLWTTIPLTAAMVADSTANPIAWNQFNTVPTISAYTAPASFPFTTTLTATAPNTAQITLTSSAANRMSALGWKTPFTLTPAYLIACNVQETTNTCSTFTCTVSTQANGIPSTTTCAPAAAYTGASVKSQSGLTLVYERPLAPSEASSHVITPGSQSLVLYEVAKVATISGVTNYNNKLFTYAPATLTAFQGTAPTFGVSASAATSTTTQVNVTTNSGKYASVGFGKASASFPSQVAICEPVSLEKCGIYTCSAASTCAASTLTVAQTRDAAKRLASLTFTNSDISSRIVLPFDEQTKLPGNNSYLFWAEDSIPTAGLTLSPSLAQGKTWNVYSLNLSPITTSPSFPVTFSAPSATSLAVTMTPGTGKTAFFGWRSDATALYPTDAVICTATNSQACIDVSCSSASSCTSRATTIYTTNTTNGTLANLVRPLAGGVTLVSNGTQNLAWDLVDTPASVTAASANSRTWKYYTAPVPSNSTSSFAAVVPSLLIAIILATCL